VTRWSRPTARTSTSGVSSPRRVPIADLLAGLADPRADERHDAGAVRHLLGWKTRPHQKQDVAGPPEPLRDRLLAHARRSGDSDKQGRAERWLAPSPG